jgi:hypothetical protein
MKKTILGAAFVLMTAATSFAAVFAATQAGAASGGLTPVLKPSDYRRTLHVGMGQETLKFEAPLGMCFLDPSRRNEGVIYRALEQVIDKKGDEKLLGVFAPCDSLANAGNPMAEEGSVMSTGLLTWPNRAIGEKSGFETRADYLDFREPSFAEYLALNLSQWTNVTKETLPAGDRLGDIVMDGEVRRSESGVYAGFTQNMTINAEKYDLTGVGATTALRGFPVEVLIRLNRYNGIDTTGEAYELMEDFLAQQAALNP